MIYIKSEKFNNKPIVKKGKKLFDKQIKSIQNNINDYRDSLGLFNEYITEDLYDIYDDLPSVVRCDVNILSKSTNNLEKIEYSLSNSDFNNINILYHLYIIKNYNTMKITEKNFDHILDNINISEERILPILNDRLRKKINQIINKKILKKFKIKKKDILFNDINNFECIPENTIVAWAILPKIDRDYILDYNLQDNIEILFNKEKSISAYENTFKTEKKTINTICNFYNLFLRCIDHILTDKFINNFLTNQYFYNNSINKDLKKINMILLLCQKVYIKFISFIYYNVKII